jgi:hypothetical protein
MRCESSRLGFGQELLIMTALEFARWQNGREAECQNTIKSRLKL